MDKNLIMGPLGWQPTVACATIPSISKRDAPMRETSVRPVAANPLIKARFIHRPNRFLVHCENKKLGKIHAHLPNPGRLWELLLPEATLYLQPVQHPPRGRPSPRKTQFTVMAVERQGHPVFLHTHKTNQVVQYLIENKRIPGLKRATVVKPEITVGRTRFDFLLKMNGKPCYLEVKSCTQFGNGIAMFPDAVTARGRRHILELADMAKEGILTAVLFVVHYPNVTWFMPDYHTDLAFSEAFLTIKNRVIIIPIAVSWNKDLTVDPSVKKLRIPWLYLKREIVDAGSYILVIRLKRGKTLNVGKLGSVSFKKGYYCYIGSAMKNLTTRTERHRRKDKKLHWHIDYLTTEADKVNALQIRASTRMECHIASTVTAIMKSYTPGFGTSDCHCRTHLFWADQDPLKQPDFQDMLQSFRMRIPNARV